MEINVEQVIADLTKIIESSGLSGVLYIEHSTTALTMPDNSHCFFVQVHENKFFDFSIEKVNKDFYTEVRKYFSLNYKTSVHWTSDGDTFWIK